MAIPSQVAAELQQPELTTELPEQRPVVLPPEAATLAETARAAHRVEQRQCFGRAEEAPLSEAALSEAELSEAALSPEGATLSEAALAPAAG